jgi:hypothetical protein
MSLVSDCVAASIALSDAAIIQQVFSFLPTGNWLFLGAVCREWKAAYADHADQRVYNFDLYCKPKLVTCDSKTTLYSAAVVSPATVRWAQGCGLAMRKNYKLQEIAGRYADLNTLAALSELDMPLGGTVCCAAALSGRLCVLQQLLSEQGPMHNGLSYCAGRSGCIDMLNWLRAQEWWCESDDDEAGAGAAVEGHLAALQHLYKEGCRWTSTVT